LQDKAVAWTRARARAELAILARRPETPVVALTSDGYDKFGPAIAPDASEIAYTRERPQDDNAAVLLSLDEQGNVTARRDLFPRGIGYQLSYSRSGRFIAYDTLAHHGRYSSFSDLFLFDRDTDKTILRSSGLRARDADIHPNGVNLAFVQFVDGRQSIVISDSGFGDRQVVYRAPSQTTRLAEPRLSPDGSAIVFIEHDDGGGEKLLLWTAFGVRLLTHGTSQDRDPSWTPDGRFVLFSSDRGGTFQIYAIEVTTGEIKQVTHRYGGAFWPIADPRGRFLFFLDNNERGYDLVRADWRPEEWWTPDPSLWLPSAGAADARGPALLPPQPILSSAAPLPAARGYAASRYLAPSHLSPSLALHRAGTELGLSFGGVDPAYRQYYDVTARWDLGYAVPVGRAYYFDARHTLPFTVEARRDVSEVEGGTDRLDLAQVTAEMFAPLGAERGRYFRFGVDGQRYAHARDVQKLAGLTAQIEGDTQLTQPNDFVPERGHAYSFEATQLLRRFDTPVYIAKARVERPFALTLLGAHSIVSAAVEGAWVGNNGRDAYLLYAGGRESAPFSQGSEFELAGYEPNRLAADRLVIGRAHFTRPVAVIQRALGTSPLLVDRLAIGARAEVGALEQNGRATTAWSFGGEGLADLEISHLWPVRVTAGLYRGRAEDGGDLRFVVTVGSR
jgi:Tol biopolymer transport system component